MAPKVGKSWKSAVIELKKSSAAVLLLVLPLLVHAQAGKEVTRTTVVWHELGEIPVDALRAGEPQNLSTLGSFVGTHNGALIVAGGASSPLSNSNQPAVDKIRTLYYDTIRVATRDSGSDQDGDGEIAPDERVLTWHDAQLTLPGNRAHGASASHKYGLIAVGGTDGNIGHGEVVLIGWNEDIKQPSVLMLPTLPSVSINGGAAVIGETLYVVVGNNSVGPTSDFYALDLSRIQEDGAGKPIADGDYVKIAGKQDEQGRPVNPWRQLPSLPQSDGENLTHTHKIVVAQNDGYGDRLYVIGGRHTSTVAGEVYVTQAERDEHQILSRGYSKVWAYDPDAKTWTRKADISINGQLVGLRAGRGTVLGQSHILVLDGPDEANQERKALSYNAITDAWATYDEVALTPNQTGLTGNAGNEKFVMSTAVRWEDDIIVALNGTFARNQLAKIWSIKVKGPDSSFGLQNMAVLVVYLLSIVIVGIYFSFRNENTNDYFRGGQKIPWWAAACSIYATMLSSLTFVALPALIYRTDWLVYFGYLAFLLVVPIAAHVVMPFFRQIDATSAYEYLSKRFNMQVRLFSSGLFTLFHVGRMGVVLALTALALASVTPLDPWHSVLIMGVLSMIYSTLGGIEAVIWTDTIQTVVLLTGAATCFGVIVSGLDGGFSGFIDTGMANNKFRMVNLDFGPGSITSLTIWVVLLGGIGQHVSALIADQAVVQRYMTTKNTKAAAKSIWANGMVLVPDTLLWFGIGTGLYCFYRAQPEKLDPTIQIDQILPTFIGAEVPVGMAGLIVAAIFAAAQSTVSTSMNSTATTLVTDFMRPFNACRTEHGYLNAARLLTLLMGVVGTLTGLLFISPEIRSLAEEYFKIIGMFMGALGGLFVLGITTRKANGRGAMVGIFTGVGVMVTVWLTEWANGFLFATIGILTCLVVGYVASLLFPSDNHDINGLTIYTMRRDHTV